MMSSSQCIVPKWNLRQQRQEEEGEGEERKRSSHVQPHQNLTNYVVPMCEDEVRELRWEKGQVGVHGMNELNQRWGGGGGGDHTLESIVHQATSSAYSAKSQQHQYAMGIKCMDENSGQVQAEQSGSKRVRSDGGGFPAEECRSRSGSATFFRDRDTDQMTWNSFDSSRSLKTARTNDHSLYHHCQENEDGGTAKEESCRSESSARRSRAAAIHNLSERRRRDRINEKMKALQKLVPNASKTDKASMLEEVIEYLKQLQAQVQMMSNASRNMMMQPLGMQAQQQLQMSLMAARMGMGMGMGMAIPPPILNPPFLPQPFSIKPMVDAHAAAAAAATISNDAYNAFLAQSMNMEFLNKMSALYKQQSSSSQQPSAKPVGLSLPNHDAQGG